MDKAENPDFVVTQANWPSHGRAIAEVRRRVFIDEQGVPEALEWEARDAGCDWFVAWAGGEPIGIARLTPEAQIGRMAVLPNWRRRGVGSALLRALLRHARDKGLRAVWLHAQTHALPFYARHGFRTEGEVFIEAGIAHRRMSLVLEGEPP